MANSFLRIAGRYSQLIGSIACAVSLAYVQWILNRDSFGPFETQVLIKYLVLNLAFFLAAFFIIRIVLPSDANLMLSSLIMAVMGAVGSSLVIDVRFILNDWGYREIAQGHSDGAINSVIFILLLNGFIAILIMGIVRGIAFVARGIQNRVAKTQLRINGGI